MSNGGTWPLAPPKSTMRAAHAAATSSEPSKVVLADAVVHRGDTLAAGEIAHLPGEAVVADQHLVGAGRPGELRLRLASTRW